MDSPEPPPVAGPTMAERTRLVRAMQAKALGRADGDPVTASIGILRADLALVAHTLFDNLGRLLDAPDGAAAPELARAVELALKVVRQEERYAHLQQMTDPAERPSDQVRRGKGSV